MNAKNPKHLARENALKFLYQHEYSANDVDQFFKHFRLSRRQQKFSKELICGTLDELQDIDREISSLSENWALKRMPAIDRNILRVGIFELRHRLDIPKKVTINEYIELAKKYGSEDSAPFVNAILDKVAGQNINQ